MSMNTEIYITCKLKKLPTDVYNVLDCLFDDGDEPTELPDHEFFKCEFWRCIADGDYSIFEIPFVTFNHVKTRSKTYSLISTSRLKNGNNEIEKFFDWINPYIEAPDGQFIGCSRYEEDLQPTLYYKTGMTEDEEV